MRATIAALISAAIIAPAAAQSAYPDARIQQGVKSGELTPKETAKLEKGQAKVQKLEDKAKADGVVTPRERAKLAKAQKKQSKKIYKETHDKQKAPKAS